MIKRGLELKPALDHTEQPLSILNQNNPYYVECDHYLNKSEWKILETAEFVLNCFFVQMKRMEGEKYVTASWVPIQIAEIHTGMWENYHAGENPQEVRIMCKKMLKDFEPRWYANRRGEDGHQGNFNIWNEELVRGKYNRQYGIHPVFIYAMCLDPRFKHLQTTFTGVQEEEKEPIWKKILALMVEHKISTITQGSGNDDEGDNNNNDEDGDKESAEESIEGSSATTVVDPFFALANLAAAEHNEKSNSVEMPPNLINQQCELELKQYRESKCLNLSVTATSKAFNNPLDWWKKHEKSFPTLAGLARKYLAIEATSAASERVFSKAQRITTADRNRLDPDLIGKLLYISTNLEYYEDYITESHYDEVLNQYNTADDDHDAENGDN